MNGAKKFKTMIHNQSEAFSIQTLFMGSSTGLLFFCKEKIMIKVTGVKMK